MLFNFKIKKCLIWICWLLFISLFYIYENYLYTLFYIIIIIISIINQNKHSFFLIIIYFYLDFHTMNYILFASTSCVDIKVCGLVGNVACRLKSWALGSDLAGVSLSHSHIHLKWTLGDVLPCKQHCHLGEQTQVSLLKVRQGSFFYTVRHRLYFEYHIAFCPILWFPFHIF